MLSDHIKEHSIMTNKLKSIIITGAGSGIGQQTALQLSDDDMNILAVGRTKKTLEETAAHKPEKITPLVADIADEKNQDLIVEAAENLPGPLAIFHSAGFYQVGKLSELGIDKWNYSFAVNVTARFSLTQKLIPQLKNGRVLFIGSDAGINIRLGAGTYSVAQSASQTLSEVMKQELKEFQIDVSSFKPGLVDTNMVQNFIKSDISEFPALTDYQKIIQSGQIATPQHIALFASWLLLKTTSQEYTENAWDIRDKWHQEKWLQ